MSKRKWEPGIIEIPVNEYEKRVGKFGEHLRRLMEEAEGLNKDMEMYKRISRYTKYTMNSVDGNLYWLNRDNKAVRGILMKIFKDLDRQGGDAYENNISER